MRPQLPGILNSESLLREGAQLLRDANIASARRESRLMLACALGISADELIASRFDVEQPVADAYFRLLERRCKREPLAYITGRKEFWSVDFSVSPAVLIPRPETETLIETALRLFPERDQPLRVLDLGTGSGCLLLVFLRERPGAQGLGIDHSEAALAIAAHNARALSLDCRAEFRKSDWLSGVSGRFDVVFANPPYIATDEMRDLAPDVRYEPVDALDGGLNGLDAYRKIATGLPHSLAPEGIVFLEIGQGQADGVGAIFRAAGFTVTATVCDLAAIPRCLVLRLDVPRQS